MSNFSLNLSKLPPDGIKAPPNTPVGSPLNSPRTSLIKDETLDIEALSSKLSDIKPTKSSLSKIQLDSDDELDSIQLISCSDMGSLLEMLPLGEKPPLVEKLGRIFAEDVQQAIQKSGSPEELKFRLEEIKSYHTKGIHSEYGEDTKLCGALLDELDLQLNIGEQVHQELDSKVSNHNKLEFGISLKSIETPKKLETCSIKQKMDLDEVCQEVEFLGKGGNKFALQITDGPFKGHVLLVAKEHGKNISEVQQEKGYLAELEKLGIPIIPIYASGTFEGRPAYIVPYLGLDSKKLVKLENGIAVYQSGHSEKIQFLTEKTGQDLKKIQSAIQSKNIAICDLQFMIDTNDGSVYLSDPGTILTPKDKKDYKTQCNRGNDIFQSLIDLTKQIEKKPTIKLSNSDDSSGEEELTDPKEIWDDVKDSIAKINNTQMPERARKKNVSDNLDELKILHANKSLFDETEQTEIQKAYDYAVKQGYI